MDRFAGQFLPGVLRTSQPASWRSPKEHLENQRREDASRAALLCVLVRIAALFTARRSGLSTSQPYVQLTSVRSSIVLIRNESEVSAIVACRRDTAQVLSVLVTTESLALRCHAALPKGM